MTFYEAWLEVRRIRKAMGHDDANDSYKTLRELVRYWARNPWYQ